MDYKKILPSLELRLKLLGLLNFVPDKSMISLQYWIKTGSILNLENPKRYTEKIQWYKLFYRDQLMVECSDKYQVKEYVKSKGLGDIVVPTYGIYEDADEINFENLPNKFVIKSTNGGGGNNVILCEDYSVFNKEAQIRRINSWLNISTAKSPGREWAYDAIEPKIIVEKYIESNNNNLIDYKFFCFNGKPLYLYL